MCLARPESGAGQQAAANERRHGRHRPAMPRIGGIVGARARMTAAAKAGRTMIPSFMSAAGGLHVFFSRRMRQFSPSNSVRVLTACETSKPCAARPQRPWQAGHPSAKRISAPSFSPASQQAMALDRDVDRGGEDGGVAAAGVSNSGGRDRAVAQCAGCRAARKRRFFEQVCWHGPRRGASRQFAHLRGGPAAYR